MLRAKSRFEGTCLRIAIVFLLAPGVCCVIAQEGPASETELIEAELNTDLSRLVSRLDLVEAAGLDHKSGQYLVRLFQVSVGAECEVESNLCEGVDLFVSAASPDLYGDHALYRITGLKRWEFRGWNSYADVDSPEHFTSFKAAITTRDGDVLEGCRGYVPSGSEIIIFVNPWKAMCKACDPKTCGSTGQ